jgi:hypothetical protein
MLDSLGDIILLFISSGLFFVIGHLWGYRVVNHFQLPLYSGFIFPGQIWKIPRLGEVIIYDVWPETVSYYLIKSRHESDPTVYTMNREDFEKNARDEKGRDGLGRFRKPIEERVIKFELREGGKKAQDI